MRPNVRAFVDVVVESLKLATEGEGSGPEYARRLRVLEVGSMVIEDSEAARGSTVRDVVMRHFPEATYVGVDMRAGPGVDLVADVEDVGETVRALTRAGYGQLFDLVLCLDTLEHSRRPWKAADTMQSLVDSDGLIVVGVPFTFQIHSHPSDYWRFTIEGLTSLFDRCQSAHVYQDPDGSAWPHTVLGVFAPIFRRGIVEAVASRVEAESARWHTGQENVIPVPANPITVLSFKDRADQENFMRSLQQKLGAGPTETLEEGYQRLARTPSDINEHMPVLRELASQCESVLELGIREAVSTTALLAAQPKRMVSVDVEAMWVQRANAIFPKLEGMVTDYKAVCFSSIGEEARAPGNPTDGSWDMLFVDTLHNYDQLLGELRLHAPKIKKWIALHDTVTFNKRDELGDGPGLGAAIDHFLIDGERWGCTCGWRGDRRGLGRCPLNSLIYECPACRAGVGKGLEPRESAWVVKRIYTNNNGLTILERVGAT